MKTIFIVNGFENFKGDLNVHRDNDYNIISPDNNEN